MKRIQIKERLEKREIEKQKNRDKLERSRMFVHSHKTIGILWNKILEPLFMKLEKQFQKNFEIPELQKRKDQLKRIREMKGKPLNHTDIIEHEQRYESIVRQRMAELEEERVRRQANKDYDPTKFKTRINQKVHQEDEIKRRLEQEKQHQKKLLAERMMSYGEFVK